MCPDADTGSPTCDLSDLSLIPAAKDTDADDDSWSTVEFTPGVHIADDAKSPKGWPDLPGNKVTVEPLAIEPPTAAARATTALPAAVKGVSLATLDIDATDNTDNFTIMVAEADSTGGGGGSQGGGSGGGLPITGAPAMVVAGVGMAALVVGGLLMFLTHRREPSPRR